MKYIFYLMSLGLVGCTISPKCGNPEGASIVYLEKTCKVRIRQVVIGDEMHVPESLKGSGFAGYEVGWQDSILQDGRIILGHFILYPKRSGENHEK